MAGVADSGEEALRLLDRTRVGLVLMDVNMPGMSGFEAAAEIRARYPHLAVVLLSVDTSPNLRAAAEQNGARFVPKAAFGPDVLDTFWDASSRGDK